MLQKHVFIQSGRTALHLASQSGNIQIVRLLQSKEANVNFQTEVSSGTCMSSI